MKISVSLVRREHADVEIGLVAVLSVVVAVAQVVAEAVLAVGKVVVDAAKKVVEVVAVVAAVVAVVVVAVVVVVAAEVVEVAIATTQFDQSMIAVAFAFSLFVVSFVPNTYSVRVDLSVVQCISCTLLMVVCTHWRDSSRVEISPFACRTGAVIERRVIQCWNSRLHAEHAVV